MEWSKFFNSVNTYMSELADGFKKYNEDRNTIEQARDNVRHCLYRLDKDMFPMGHSFISVTDLILVLAQSSTSIAKISQECIHCDKVSSEKELSSYFIELQISTLNIQSSDSVADVIRRFLNMKTLKKCKDCNNEIYKNIYFNNMPYILFIHLPYTSVKISIKFKLNNVLFKLRGIVYHGDYHYTARLMSSDGSVWYHDGMNNGNLTSAEGNFQSGFKRSTLNTCKGKNVCILVYNQDL
jgi:hypothetical protein